MPIAEARAKAVLDGAFSARGLHSLCFSWKRDLVRSLPGARRGSSRRLKTACLPDSGPRGPPQRPSRPGAPASGKQTVLWWEARVPPARFGAPRKRAPYAEAQRTCE
ncbi:MAG TPA: hypothetical protein VKU00_08930 [Chthonomonadaceae bacterium]|nr:hypothetical protein [Chthonomonadaceae bacterium]